MNDSYAHLMALIISPIILLGTCILVVLKVFFREDEKLISIAMLNPDHGLAKQMLFWVVILTPVAYFVEFGIIAWEGYDLSLNKAGFDEFINSSKLPLGLLSLSIPLTALVAKLHSTSQTAKQIGLATRQIAVVQTKNNHDLFYSHRKEYVSFYEQVGSITWLNEYVTSYKLNPRIHARIFSGEAPDGVPALRYDHVDRMVAKLKDARKSLAKAIMAQDLDTTKDSFIEFSRAMYYFITHFGIVDLAQQVSKSSVDLVYLDDKHMRRVQPSAGGTTEQAIAIYRCVKSYLVTTMEFAGYRRGIVELNLDAIGFVDSNDEYKSANELGYMIEKVIKLTKLPI